MTSGLYEPDLVNASVGKWYTGILTFSSPATFFTKKKVAFLHPTFGKRISLKEVTPINLFSKVIHVISNGKMPMEQLSEILEDIHPFA